MDSSIRLENAHDLEIEIEELFPYCGEFNRTWVDRPFGGRIVAVTCALVSRKPRSEPELLRAMYDRFVEAKQALGNRTDVGIMWRRRPHLVTEDDGKLLLRLRMALVDGDGQIHVSGLPTKAEGVPSKSID